MCQTFNTLLPFAFAEQTEDSLDQHYTVLIYRCAIGEYRLHSSLFVGRI